MTSFWGCSTRSKLWQSTISGISRISVTVRDSASRLVSKCAEGSISYTLSIQHLRVSWTEKKLLANNTFYHANLIFNTQRHIGIRCNHMQNVVCKFTQRKKSQSALSNSILHKNALKRMSVLFICGGSSPIFVIHCILQPPSSAFVWFVVVVDSFPKLWRNSAIRNTWSFFTLSSEEMV